MADDPITRRYRRRERAAARGDHLPDERELLRGMSFLSNDINKDAAEFASRLARRIRRRRQPALDPLALALDELELGCLEDSVDAIVRQLEDVPTDRSFSRAAVRLRCRIYLANLGRSDAIALTAAAKAKAALDERYWRPEDRFRLALEALGWATMAARMEASTLGVPRNHYASRINGEAESIGRSFRSVFEHARDEAGPEPEFNADPDPIEELSFEKEPLSVARAQQEGVVVFTRIGNATTTAGKQVQIEFSGVVGVRLPLPGVPNDLAAVRRRLLHEFPYAEEIVDLMLGPLAYRDCVRIPPTVLIGSPGSGKTRFARRLAEELGLSCEVVPCGGISDSSLGGTPRQWHTGQPSLPVITIRRAKSAGPLIVLDEIDKTGVSRNNGALHDVLLGLLEQESAARWMDPYVLAPCDLRHVTWIMTANAPDPIPHPLRDRLRFLRFPDPRAGDLGVLAARLLQAGYAERNLDPRWAMPLDGMELEALSSAWQGGSMRVLQRLVECIIKTRDAGGQSH
ncbi:AAA family ATPase [Tianweitania sediminis]|uniref:AAA family ATPase n=1 Tax=Tianweitania sediminis TaxID=1502156 RepID=A0A8J7RLL7_9HYPH|nr:AAA family ATPase [Tianweitania sediminis]MBP0437979.1 AAA family ATPase [Tianweitania sediminis]